MLYTPAFAALYLANLATVASFAAFFLFPLLITAHGGDQQDIGIIMGTFALASAACRPWVAEMVDRLGRKRSFSIGCSLMLIMPLLHLLLRGPLDTIYGPLLLIRSIHGIGLAICFNAVFTFIVDLIPVQRLNEGIGMFGTSGLVGLAIGPAIAEPVLKHYGETAFFLASAALALIGLLVQLPVRDRYREQPPAPHASSPSFFALLRKRKQLICGGLALIFGFGLAATSNFIAPLAQQRQLGYVSTYYFAYSCAAIGIRVVVGRLADRIGERQLIPWGLVIAASGLLFLPLVHSNPLLMIFGFLFGLGHGLLFPSLNAMAVRDEPMAVRGKITGIFTGGIDTGNFCGSLLLGVIGELCGYPALFIAAGLVLLGGLWLARAPQSETN